MKKSMSLLLILTLLLPPASFAKVHVASDQVIPERRHNIVLSVLLDELNSRYERIMSSVPAQTVNAIEIERKVQINEAINKKRAELASGEISVEQWRNEAAEINREALQQQKDELLYQISNLRTEELDRIAAVMQNNLNYLDAQQEYQAAYTRTEKARALSHAIISDLDQHLSMLNKSSRFMSKEAWLRDLSRTQSAFNTKGSSSRKWLKILGYAALGVAAAGLVSWGVASSVYGSKYNKRKSELDRQFEDFRSELEKQYNDLNARLTQEELNYLSNSGFVLSTCGTFQRPSSILCNRYNYQLFSGTTFCSVSCYRNPTTGGETLHSAPACTSPYIPSDCYDPQEYSDGYDNGYDDGYDQGHGDGVDDGDYDGGEDGWEDGSSDGEWDGYDQGYSDGFQFGYESYWGYTLMSSPISSTQYSQKNYNKGYQDGQSDAHIVFGGVK
ncbi:MAG TPA: hypothetical protein DCS07_05865 [Bdellovibrionales bacterium]|nr:MAG: hypothetical protein A2Z97_06550 [Bdellovibrionales bacterium GWB1_52_6]OFZ05142.1 MAG: hypothetical protein A2X97_09315 [Bdellovibrionales bacterium GWA1_52_35]HAR42143.1 hypothetical protein [Bdellovibrionales bacterium]HCM38892.1 hypothetical protein [Bdellovibrionales bacterium]